MADLYREVAMYAINAVMWLFAQVVAVGGLQTGISGVVYIIPLLSLPLAVGRQFRRDRPLACILLAIFVYLVFTRLTTFKTAQVTVGALLGNFAFFALVLKNAIPGAWWPVAREWWGQRRGVRDAERR